MDSKQIFMTVTIIAILSLVMAFSVVMIAPPIMAQMADNASMGNLTGGNMTDGISSLPGW